MKKKKNIDNMHIHCPEVEELMGGKMPFVTRHGITLVALVLVIIVTVLCLHKGPMRRLMKDMVEWIGPQIIRVI